MNAHDLAVRHRLNAERVRLAQGVLVREREALKVLLRFYARDARTAVDLAEIVAGGKNAPDLCVDLLQLCVG